MIERNETTSDMATRLGQSVLKSKANLSYDCGKLLGDIRPMAERMSETEEKLAFIKRVKLARESRFEKQGPILTILEIDQGTYKQYESRTELPRKYIPKFCAATGVSMEWLLTGEGKGPVVEEFPKETQKLVSKPRRGKAA